MYAKTDFPIMRLKYPQVTYEFEVDFNHLFESLKAPLSFIFAFQLKNLQKAIIIIIENLNFLTPKFCCNHPKILTNWPYRREMSPKNADETPKSEDPDQTAPLGAV